MEFLDKIMHLFEADMTPPPAYGLIHILLIVIGLPTCILLGWLLRRLDDKKNKIFILSFAGVLILSEIFKHLFIFFVDNGHAFDWGEFPFQMCSMPMYLCPLAVLCKNERLSRAAYTFMMCFNLLGGFAGAFEPSGIFLDQIALTVHAVIWHFSLIFLGFYIMFSRRAGTEKRDLIDTIKLFLLLCFIAFVINTLIGITVNETANMFFVGPNRSPIIVFKQIAEKYGWVASTLIYIPVTSLAAGLIFLLNKAIKKK